MPLPAGGSSKKIRDVRAYTGIVDSRTIRRRYPIKEDGTITAATLARAMCPTGKERS